MSFRNSAQIGYVSSLMSCVVAGLSSLLFSVAAFSEARTDSETPAKPVVQTQRWINPRCAHHHCDLKEAQLITYRNVTATAAATQMTASFSTVKAEQLKDFAFVQYLIGCGSTVEPSGARTMAKRTNLGVAGVDFQHQSWQLDTGPTTDPVYQATQGSGDDPLRGFTLPRTGSYYVTNPITTPEAKSWGGIETNVTQPKLFIMDAPTGSSLESDGTLAISSLRFRTCLYRVADVPESVDSADHIFPKAIHCFEWASNFRYRASSKRFVASKKIDAFCQVHVSTKSLK